MGRGRRGEEEREGVGGGDIVDNNISVPLICLHLSFWKIRKARECCCSI